MLYDDAQSASFTNGLRYVHFSQQAMTQMQTPTGGGIRSTRAE
jgi:hypothetical protein